MLASCHWLLVDDCWFARVVGRLVSLDVASRCLPLVTERCSSLDGTRRERWPKFARVCKKLRPVPFVCTRDNKAL